MIIKAKIKGIETEITIPDSKYWVERNKQRVTPYWNNADNLEKRMNKEFQAAFKDLEKELYTFAGKQTEDGILTYSQNRVVALMKEIKPHVDKLYGSHQTSLTDLLMETYKDNYFKALYDLSRGTKIYGSFVGINERAIKAAISFPWSGANFSDRIYNNKNRLIGTLRTELTQSIIRGDSIKTTARTVASRLDISAKNAGRLVQTEMGSVMSMSDKAAYKEYDVDEYEYCSVFDARTSQQCRDMDGQVFRVDDMVIGVNAPSLHPNCRSSTTAFFSDAMGSKLVKGLDDGKYKYIDSNIDYRTFEQDYID